MILEGMFISLFLTRGYVKHRNKLLGWWSCVTRSLCKMLAILRMLVGSADPVQGRED